MEWYYYFSIGLVVSAIWGLIHRRNKKQDQLSAGSSIELIDSTKDDLIKKIFEELNAVDYITWSLFQYTRMMVIKTGEKSKLEMVKPMIAEMISVTKYIEKLYNSIDMGFVQRWHDLMNKAESTSVLNAKIRSIEWSKFEDEVTKEVDSEILFYALVMVTALKYRYYNDEYEAMINRGEIRWWQGEDVVRYYYGEGFSILAASFIIFLDIAVDNLIIRLSKEPYSIAIMKEVIDDLRWEQGIPRTVA